MPGQPVAEAVALGNIRLEPYDPVADRAALEQVAIACEPFSPIVGLEDADPPECLFLDITGLEPLFGDERELVEQVARLFSQRGLVARLAVADTAGAAWGVAHSQQTNDGMATIVPPQGTVTALSPLPVSVLRLPPDMVALLAELGIRRIEHLLAIPRAALASRFAGQLLRRLDQALGTVPETIDGRRPPPEVVAERKLEYPLDSRAGVEQLLAQLLVTVTTLLAERQQGIVQLECRLSCESQEPDTASARPATGDEVAFVVGLYRASAVTEHLLELLKLRLERCQLPGPVTAARLAALLTARLQTHQQELFGEPRADPRQLGLLVDRLSGRLERQAVLRAKLQPDAQPEHAYRLEPLAGNRAPQRSRPGRAAKAASTGELLPRPLWIEPRPLAVEVLSIIPSGPPQRFCFQGQEHAIRQSWGPERIQTGWWRGAYIRRDYYRVETTAGERFWLFRDRSGRWFLHGVFD
ncbi:MAG: DNA polymerase Y family protein [Planctomycetaceae bacterium]|nr:DNA polymerase Y family protein [Planctomycetaceae bacterium]